MKYFTPDRYVRFQDTSDERAFLATSAEWEEAVHAYRRELKRITPKLPESVQRFLKSGSLHDANLTAVWRTRTRLSLLVRTESPSDHYALLVYSLVKEPALNHSALPPEHRTEQSTWLYDEIALLGTNGTRRPADGGFVHSILLSNGLEMTIYFKRFEISWPNLILPDTHQSSEHLQASES